MSSKNKSEPDLVIKCGILLTMAHDSDPLYNVDIEVINGIISAIKPCHSNPRGQEYDSQTRIVDASRDLVIPGMVNCHNHVSMTLFRGMADDLPLKVWLFEKIFPAEGRFLSPETVYWGSLLGCAEMIAFGTTCFADGYFFEDSVIKAVYESRIRVLAAQGIIDFPAPGIPEPDNKFQTAKSFIERHQGISDLIVPSIFCHSPITCSESTLVESKGLCLEFGVPLQIHLCETEEENRTVVERTGMRPVPFLNSLGILGPDLIAAHCVHLESDELSLLESKGVKVVHVPESNMKLASGIARVADMIQVGIKPALGTDGCASNNNLDLFTEMDMAAKLAKVFNQDPVVLPAKTVLKMATIWGASALGMGSRVGNIEVGKQADLVVIDMDQPHLQPLYDPFSTVVYSAKGGDVKHVVVNGDILYENRDFTRLDIDKIMWHVKRICQNIGHTGFDF